MAADFIIDQVSWHTSVAGNPEDREQVVARFWSVVRFLQQNELTTRILADGPQSIGDVFCIQKSDLTERGFLVMKQAYDKWLKKVDRGMSPEDLSLLERAFRESIAVSRPRVREARRGGGDG